MHRCRPSLHFLVFVCSLLATARAELRLEYVLPDGTVLDQFITDEREITAMTPQGRVPVPLEGTWGIRGPIFDSPGANWVPTFAVRPLPDLRAGVPRMYDALVTLQAGTPHPWSVEELRGSIAVFIWWSQGRITQVSPVPIRTVYLREGEIVASARFRLSGEEGRGLPALLLLRTNEWMHPKGRRLPAGLVRSILRDEGTAASSVLEDIGKIESRERQGALQFLIAARASATLAQLLSKLSGTLAATDWTSLREAAVRSGARESLDILMAAGGRISPNDLASLIETAVLNNQEACALALVEDARKQRIRLPRHDELAALAIDEGLAKLLLPVAGSTLPKAIGKLDRERFARVARQGHVDMVRLLIQNGIKLARVDPDATALTLAIAADDRELTRIYLAAGGRPDPLSASIDGPLIYAVKAGTREIVDDLLAAGADPNRVKARGISALSAAVTFQNDDMVRWTLARFGSRLSAETLSEALECALRLRRSHAVAELVKAGAKLTPARIRSETVVDILAVDNADLWKTILAQGWKRENPVAGSLNATMAALAFRATDCLHAMNRPAGDIPQLVLEVPDLPPRAAELAVPYSIRALDRAWPALTMNISGLVDEQGALRCVSVTGSDDFLLQYQLRVAAEKFRFTPARKAGQAIRAHIQFPMILESAPKRMFQMTELDLPPIAISDNGRLQGYTAASVGPLWKSYGTPGGLGLANEIASVLYALDSGGIETTNNPNRDVDGSLLPLVSFIVGRDGVVRDAKTIWAADRYDSEGALRRAAQLRYLPGIARGRTVEVPITMRVSGR